MNTDQVMNSVLPVATAAPATANNANTGSSMLQEPAAFNLAKIIIIITLLGHFIKRCICHRGVQIGFNNGISRLKRQ